MKANCLPGLAVVCRLQLLLFALSLMAPGRGPGERFPKGAPALPSGFFPLPASRLLIWVSNLGLDFLLSCFHPTRVQSNSSSTSLFFLHYIGYMIGLSHFVPFLLNPDTLPSCTFYYLQTSLSLQTSLGTFSLCSHLNCH